MKTSIGLLALAAVGGLAAADELPQRKPGLWEIVTQPSKPDQKPMMQRLCLDREIDAQLTRMGFQMGAEACSKFDVHRMGSRVTLHSECTFGSSKFTSDAVMTYTGDSAYRNESHGRFNPPMMGMGETHTVQDAKWLGACPAGMQPGDAVMTDASGREVHMNMRAMLKGKP